jgi:nitroreductase
MVFDTINFYKKFDVAITDRFHGFVFSLIAKTPCVALVGGIPHKIKGYQSFFEKQLGFVDSIKNIPIAITSAIKNFEFEKVTDFSEYFDNFKKIIEEHSDEPQQESFEKNNISDIIKNRRTVRRWIKKRVEEKKIKTVLEAGMYAPSAGNIQAVRFLIINDQNVVSFICNNTCEWFKLNYPPVIIAVLYDLKKAKERGFDFTKNHKWSRFIWQDSSAAIENMILMAKALSLESCWVSIPAKKRKILNVKKYSNREEKIRKILKIGERYFLTSLVFVGYSDSCGNLKSRHQGHPIQRNYSEFVLNSKEFNDFKF